MTYFKKGQNGFDIKENISDALPLDFEHHIAQCALGCFVCRDATYYYTKKSIWFNGSVTTTAIHFRQYTLIDPHCRFSFANGKGFHLE